VRHIEAMLINSGFCELVRANKGNGVFKVKEPSALVLHQYEAVMPAGVSLIQVELDNRKNRGRIKIASNGNGNGKALRQLYKSIPGLSKRIYSLDIYRTSPMFDLAKATFVLVFELAIVFSWIQVVT